MMEWLRHSCRLPMQDRMVIRAGTTWTCPKCDQTWKAVGFLGAADDLWMIRVQDGAS